MNDDDNHGEKEVYEEQKEKIEKAYVKGAKEYVMDDDIGNNLVFMNSLEKINYSSKIKKLGFLEVQSPKLKLYDLKLQNPEIFNLQDYMKGGFENNCFIVDFEICEEDDKVN